MPPASRSLQLQLVSGDPDSKFAVILNPASRHGRRWAQIVSDSLGSRAEFVVLASKPWVFQEAIQRAQDAGVQKIWVGGGDGSIRAAAAKVAGTKSVLYILPLGTGNALAHELGIPMLPRMAIDFHLNHSIVRSIDVGLFQDDPFVTIATLGLTTGIMENIRQSNKGVFGRLVYLPAVIKAIHFSRSFEISVAADGQVFEGKALQFVAAASRTHAGPFAVTENAANDDGLLSLYVLSDAGRGSLVRYGWALLIGRQTQLPEVWCAEASSVTVKLKSPKKFVVDGDPIRAIQANIGIRPRDLLVSAAPV